MALRQFGDCSAPLARELNRFCDQSDNTLVPEE